MKKYEGIRRMETHRLSEKAAFLVAVLVSVSILFAPKAIAQTTDRVVDVIDMRHMVSLKGNVHPNARKQFDKGPVPSDFLMSDLSIVLQPTDEQNADMNQLLTELQDKSSPNYHKWLTPEEYADRFGLNTDDIAKITNWLESQGFTIVRVARGRDSVTFNGTAGQVASAFATEIRRYEVNGEVHFANSSSPSVPKAMSGMVAGIRGLHDFYPKPSYTTTNGLAYLAPGDLAMIYDLTPLYNNGIDGTGQTIAVVGQANANVSPSYSFFSDPDQFFTAFGLPYNIEAIQVGSYAGLFSSIPPAWSTGAPAPPFNEADGDIELIGSVAPNAKIVYLYAPDFMDAVAYAIDQNVGSVISVSLGTCEATAQASGDMAMLEPQLQRAGSQGITIVAASGDTGAFACDQNSGETEATHGIAVLYPASSPYVTGVGGTQLQSIGVAYPPYWTNTNSANGGSAQSYIPEEAWDIGMNASSGGGSSAVFPTPSWQVGLNVPETAGVPNNGRFVPDVAMSANNYIYCTQGSCANGINNAVQNLAPSVFQGTSAATPVFAGIVALLNEYSGGHGLGNINPMLYQLAQGTGTVFHQIQSGNNDVPCQVGTANCSNGEFGYSAGPGYNQVTGLGSVDACNLVTEWTKPVSGQFLTGTTATFAGGVTTTLGAMLGKPVLLMAYVSRLGNLCAPSGTVTFIIQNPQTGQVFTGTGTLTNGVASYTTSSLPIGAYSVYAAYGGDSNDAESNSILSPLLLGVSPKAGTTLTETVRNLPHVCTGLTITVRASTSPGLPAPTGTVTLYNASTNQPLAANTLSAGAAVFNVPGANTGSLRAGVTYCLTAQYSGDVNYTPTVSVPFTVDPCY